MAFYKMSAISNLFEKIVSGKVSRTTWTAVMVILLSILAGFFVYPKAWNKSADWLNAQKNQISVLKSLPNIPQFFNRPFRLGLDLQGGTHLVYEADLSNVKSENYLDAMQGVRDVIERRVNLFGVSEPLVQIENASQPRLIVELAGIKDIHQAINMIGETPSLDFREERGAEETQQILDRYNSLSEEEKKNFKEDPYFRPTELTGKNLEKSSLEFDPNTSRPYISLEFNSDGAALFEAITARNVGKRVAIYLDNTAISVPTVQEAISGGKAQISGSFTVLEAKQLAQRLNAGALPVPIKLISQQSVGPTLGQKSLDQSFKAAIFGFLAILLFLIIFYRIPGFFAAFSLIMYIVFLLAIFKIFQVTLTLAGIAGFILSMGMAVDANILIFSRMREELKEGKSFLESVRQGFKRAWPSIRDGNFTTILVGLILFFLGSSFVKGFALILVIGNIIGMGTAIFITYYLLKFFPKNKTRQAWIWY